MEKDENKELEKSNRRNFLKKSVLFGGAAVIGGGIAKGLGNHIESGKKIKALTPEGDVIEINDSDLSDLKSAVSITKKKLRKGEPDRKFVMVIDLSRCKNERKCQSGCKKMHHLPEDVNWLKVYKMQDAKTTAPYWMPAPWFHCDNPPCVKVCPVDATFIREDGIVLIDNERCIGCRFCMAACPYSARTFNWSKPELPDINTEDEKNCHISTPRMMGTVEKCDFCVDVLVEGQLPKCVTSCPNGVFYMGDLNEDTVSNINETVRFSELIESKAGYRFMEDLGTQPSVYYLPPAGRIFPFKDNSNE